MTCEGFCTERRDVEDEEKRKPECKSPDKRLQKNQGILQQVQGLISKWVNDSMLEMESGENDLEPFERLDTSILIGGIFLPS